MLQKRVYSCQNNKQVRFVSRESCTNVFIRKHFLVAKKQHQFENLCSQLWPSL